MTPRNLSMVHQQWQAANYLSAAQIYLKENALLKEPLAFEHIKPRLLGHWGTCPGLNFIYAHLNRVLRETKRRTLFVAGPGHGAPAIIANSWLEGSWTQFYPDVERNLVGLNKLVRSFSWPGGIASHVTAQVPGSIHEGGELGYSLSHAFGAVLDQPDLTVACVIGDGEAETAALASAWQFIHFLNPVTDGAVLPILHLNGYKISSPTVLSRMTDLQLRQLFAGYGYDPVIVTAHPSKDPHEDMAKAMDNAYATLRSIQQRAHASNMAEGQWPLIILRSPKGWTGPAYDGDKPLEGSFRSHQIPIKNVKTDPLSLKQLEHWLKSYHPEVLFHESGTPSNEVMENIPPQTLCMGSVDYTPGTDAEKPLTMPDFQEYAACVHEPGKTKAEATKQLGGFLRDVMALNEEGKNFRIFCPDEMTSNRLDAVFDVTDRRWMLHTRSDDESLSPDGRVLEILSEHCCQGWMEGYLLTGRHALFPCYEAFITIVDSMVSQYAKWIKMSNEIPWRKPLSSMNYLLTSHAWRQDHNGYSHQGPGFINTLLQKKKDIARIYLPADANTLLTVSDHCLRSKNYINLIISGKQPEWQWLNMEEAIEHGERGSSVWEWASYAKENEEPDVVLACAGDVPTLETLAAVQLLKAYAPEVKTRVVNVVDLMALCPQEDHPHGLDEKTFNEQFTQDKPVIFAFHGYPRTIHELIYRRSEPERFHVHGYIEEGTTTTPFDMTVCNRMSRYDLAIDVLRRVKNERGIHDAYITYFNEKLVQHKIYIREHGEDLREIRDWEWEPEISDIPPLEKELVRH